LSSKGSGCLGVERRFFLEEFSQAYFKGPEFWFGPFEAPESGNNPFFHNLPWPEDTVGAEFQPRLFFARFFKPDSVEGVGVWLLPGRRRNSGSHALI